MSTYIDNVYHQRVAEQAGQGELLGSRRLVPDPQARSSMTAEYEAKIKVEWTDGDYHRTWIGDGYVGALTASELKKWGFERPVKYEVGEFVAVDNSTRYAQIVTVGTMGVTVKKSPTSITTCFYYFYEIKKP